MFLQLLTTFTRTGGGHRRPAGHADVRGVLRLLQDDVSETGPVPADDGVQRQEGPPDGGGAHQLPAQRAEGERSHRSRVGANEIMTRCPNYFLSIDRFHLRSSHKDGMNNIPPHCLLTETCLSCLPGGISSTKLIYHAQNCFASLEPSSCFIQFFFALLSPSFVFLTHSLFSPFSMVSFFIKLHSSSPACHAQH